MEAYFIDWLNLLARWVHFITGVAWIGSSFYFVWLDNHLEAPALPADDEKGVGGELWSVHGGGFYHAQKYRVAPQVIPDTLHWFKWEAYSTWLSGMFLLVVVYWYGAQVYLIDPAVAELSPLLAVGRVYRRRLDHLRSAVQVAPEQQRKVIFRRVVGACVFACLGSVSIIWWPRRVHPFRCRARNHHGGECILRHHSRPEKNASCRRAW